MTNLVYGIDLNSGEPITPLMVRDAMSLCLYVAHCQDFVPGGEKNGKTMSREDCRDIVEKAFADCGGDFENPTKESILCAMKELRELAKSFREPAVINEHASKIMQLVEKIKG